MPRIAVMITNLLRGLSFQEYRAFGVEGMPQVIRGAFTDPHDNVVWEVTLRRLN